tara:strand:+ start:8155 stop:8346 length:192 start_codon:yes stop_codon:yes gene_type:complete
MDLVKCYGEGCKKKEHCLRHTQEDRKAYQAYFTQRVAIKDVDACPFFMDNDDTNQKESENVAV